jgi:hypothetical protein
MGPVAHYLFGALCGAAVACVVLLFRRRWAAWAPPFVLACGFWGELPWVLGFGQTTHWLSNVFFGYGWLHPAFRGGEPTAFVLFLVVANLFVVAYTVFLTRYFWTVDMVRWEAGDWRRKRRGSKRRRRSPRPREEED